MGGLAPPKYFLSVLLENPRQYLTFQSFCEDEQLNTYEFIPNNGLKSLTTALDRWAHLTQLKQLLRR